MRVIGLMLSCLLLASCAASEPAAQAPAARAAAVLPPDLKEWGDTEICRAAARAPDREVLAEAARRGLGDCTAGHLRCRVNGYQPGSDAYRACRQYLAEMEALAEGRDVRLPLGIERLPSAGPAGSGKTMSYAFPDGRRLSCTTLVNFISCF